MQAIVHQENVEHFERFGGDAAAPLGGHVT
jgi:hypothetical protein